MISSANSVGKLLCSLTAAGILSMLILKVLCLYPVNVLLVVQSYGCLFIMASVSQQSSLFSKKLRN